MATLRLILEYDGSDFEGWQRQAGDKRTVQGALIGAFERVTGETVRVTGSGRTDAGVHAEAQVASASVESSLAPEELRRALNAVLPPDVVIRRLERVDDDFDARRGARSKLYRYSVWNGAQRSPLRARHTLHVRQPLDLGAMQRAAADLVGEHDFASFQAAGSPTGSSVRTLYSARVLGRATDEVVFEFEGSGFLRHMVRNLVGTLLEVGRGARAPDSMVHLIAAVNRDRAGPTAPAHGLTLAWVDYGEGPCAAVSDRGPGEDSAGNSRR